jgi:hypothetical protein
LFLFIGLSLIKFRLVIFKKNGYTCTIIYSLNDIPNHAAQQKILKHLNEKYPKIECCLFGFCRCLKSAKAVGFIIHIRNWTSLTFLRKGEKELKEEKGRRDFLHNQNGEQSVGNAYRRRIH